MKNWKRLTACAAALTLVALLAAAGPTDRTAGAKMEGEFGGSARSAVRSMRHARDYSQDYRAYAGNAKKVKPAVAQEHATGVGANVKLAQLHCTAMREEVGDDSETLASINAIEKHLVDAKKAYEKMDQMCRSNDVNTQGTMTCCTEVDKALDAAIDEYQTLSRRLGDATRNDEKNAANKQ